MRSYHTDEINGLALGNPARCRDALEVHAIDPTINRLLTALDVAPHAFSVCRIQSGWRMSFPVFKVVTVHFVLRGSGHIQAGETPPSAFSPSSVLVVPALQPHWVGEADRSAATGAAADKCELIGDGLVRFTAGNGDDDTLLLCAAVSAPDQTALGLLDLLRWPGAGDMAASGVPDAIFDAMRHEVANGGLGTQAMCQALMKQALITLLRRHWSGAEADGAPVFNALQHPRLARAIVAIIEQPGADHTVATLAALAGMSRASFSDHFSRTFGQGPIDFVQKARLRVAARLLRVTDLPIKAIAQSVGYVGSRPFSRAFEQTYGMAPSLYRRPPPSTLVVPDILSQVTDRPD